MQLAQRHTDPSWQRGECSDRKMPQAPSGSRPCPLCLTLCSHEPVPLTTEITQTLAPERVVWFRVGIPGGGLPSEHSPTSAESLALVSPGLRL